jgi:hypothetical protein
LSVKLLSVQPKMFRIVCKFEKRGKRQMKIFDKLLATSMILVVVLSAFAVLSPTFATIAYVHSDYASMTGLLASDNYALYPYEKISLNVGVSQYGELVNPGNGTAGTSVGLGYDGIDAFCDPAVVQNVWSNGWVMNISYIYSGEVSARNLWAFAMFSDFITPGGSWINNASSVTGAPNGGRKTSGYAVTQPIQVIYDGPRKMILLLNTTIYDPRIVLLPYFPAPKGLPLIRLIIQVVFDKVEKSVVLIKDIKMLDPLKLISRMQVEFGEREEWDLGTGYAPTSYAHWFQYYDTSDLKNGELSTEYYQHPFYPYATPYAVCQIITKNLNHVGFVATWPQPMNWYVEDITQAGLSNKVKLTDLSDYVQKNTTIRDLGPEQTLVLSQPMLVYPGDWYSEYGYWSPCMPRVWLNGVELLGDFEPPSGSPPYSGWAPDTTKDFTFEWSYSNYGLGLLCAQGEIVFHISLNKGDVIYVQYKRDHQKDDMTNEPATPYVMYEWVFDLDHKMPQLPSDQFRCVSVYGVVNTHDADDAKIPGGKHSNVIDREVDYQLNEVFNPLDLRQALGGWSGGYYDVVPNEFSAGTTDYAGGKTNPGKWTDRWVEFYQADGVSTIYDLRERPVWGYFTWNGEGGGTYSYEPAWKYSWDSYCLPSEKVLVNGKLQIPDRAASAYGLTTGDYELEFNTSCTETLVKGPITSWAETVFSLRYDRIYPGSDGLWIENLNNGKTVRYISTSEYSMDYQNGTVDVYGSALSSLNSSEALMIGYSLDFPEASIVFTKAPPLNAQIKILYSTYGLQEATDVFIVNGQEPGFNPFDAPTFLLNHRPVSDGFCEWPLEISIWIYDEYMTITSDEAYIHYNLDYTTGALTIDYYQLTEGGTKYYLDIGDMVKVVYPVAAGRYEWTDVGQRGASVDSAGAALVTQGIVKWNDFDVNQAVSLDVNDTKYGPQEPFIFSHVSGKGTTLSDYYDSNKAQSVCDKAGRAYLKDHWCRPADWNDSGSGSYWNGAVPVASSNIIVVGGDAVNLGAEYFNDFSDVFAPRIGSTFYGGVTSTGCWSRNYYAGPGYAVITTCKDKNGTVALLVYGYSGQDTYYACYALEHGLLDIAQWLQPGITSLILWFNYTLHPSEQGFFTVVEAVGTITEYNGFEYMWDPTTWETNGSWLIPTFWDAIHTYGTEFPYSLMTIFAHANFQVFGWDSFDPLNFVGYWWRLQNVLPSALNVSYPDFAFPRKMLLRMGSGQDNEHLWIIWKPGVHPDS